MTVRFSLITNFQMLEETAGKKPNHDHQALSRHQLSMFDETAGQKTKTNHD